MLRLTTVISGAKVTVRVRRWGVTVPEGAGPEAWPISGCDDNVAKTGGSVGGLPVTLPPRADCNKER